VTIPAWIAIQPRKSETMKKEKRSPYNEQRKKQIKNEEKNEYRK